MPEKEPQEPVTTARFIVEGPRWAKIPAALKDAAHYNEVDLRLDIDRGWIREHIRVLAMGDSANIATFVDQVLKAMKAYGT